MDNEATTAVMETNLTPEAEYLAYAENADQNELADRGLAERPKAAEPAPKEEPAKAEPEKSKSVNRIGYKEIREENDRLRRELEEARKQPAAKKEPEVTEEPAKPEALRARPKPDDKNEKGESKYKTWEEYEDDLLSWHGEKTLRDIDERSAKRTQEQQVTAINKQIEQSWMERCEKAAEKYEDFEQAADPQGATAKMIHPGSLVDEWIMDSEQGAEILYYFYKNPAELKKFESVPGNTPGARRATTRRWLIEIENKIGAESNEPEPEQPGKAAEPEPRITKAPPPSRAIGGRGAQPVDRARAAVANDDVAAYMDEANEREIRQKFGDRRR